MPRTLQNYLSDVLRKVRGQATPLAAQQAIQDAVNFIDSKANWEFLLKASLVNIEPFYTTGIISVVSGTTAVTLVGGTWDVNWRYKSIQFTTRQLAYQVASFNTATTATLASSLSGSTSISGGTYKIYQDRYALPADCEPGRDLFVRGPRGYGREGEGIIRKIGRMAFENKRDPYTSYGNVACYTDGDYDETNRVGTIILYPYPTAGVEYHIIYYKKMTVPTTLGSFIHIPEAFEKLIVNLAASDLMRDLDMKGWMALRQEAEGTMERLYARHAASPSYESVLEVWDHAGGISVSDSLMHVHGPY